jgi:hypothetical protein
MPGPLRRTLYTAEVVVTGGRDGEGRTGVGLGPLEGRLWGLSEAVEVDLPRLDGAEARRLVSDAHAVCPYSNATRGSLHVEITVAARSPSEASRSDARSCRQIARHLARQYVQ